MFVIEPIPFSTSIKLRAISIIYELAVRHNNTDCIVRYENADRVIAATKADIRYGGNQAYYNRRGDFIQVPLREQFSASEYYETVFHEICHWCQHPNRLDSYKTGSYAFNELVAEIGACFVSSEIGLPTAASLPNHVSYLDHWLKAMKSDHKFIFQASSQASKAADFILSFSRVEQVQIEEVLAE